MAYTQVQTISDTDRRHVVKRVNYATTETGALVVNAAALTYAVVQITTGSSSNNFKIGETVNSTSGGTGVVQDVLSSTKVNLINVVGTFANNDIITGQTTLRTRTQSGVVVPDTYRLQVSRILYDVQSAASGEKIALMWEGNGGGANNGTIAILSGTGVLEFDTHAARIPNNANNATGNITVSTLHWDTKSSYTLVVDVSKVEGYASPRSVYGV